MVSTEKVQVHHPAGLYVCAGVCKTYRLTTMAGKIFYLPPIDYTSGKIYGKKYNFTSVYRPSGQHPRGCAMVGTRRTPYSQSEVNMHTRFKAVVTATRKRLQDASKIQQDLQAFKSQSVYRTLYQYVFNQEWSAYQD